LFKEPAAQRLFLDWYLHEVLRYLNEKGFRFVYSKWGDEWGPEYLATFLAGAVPMHKLGWKIMANPGDAVMTVPDYRQQLKSVIDISLDYGKHHVAFIDEIQKERKLIAPDGLMFLATSSWWWNKPLDQGFHDGYAMAFNDRRAHHYHGWHRNSVGGQGVALDMRDGKFDLRPSVGYQYLGEGIQEAEYLTMALRLIKAGEMSGKKMDAYRKEVADIIGPEGKLVKLTVSDFDGLLYPREGIPLTTYQQAKESLLDLILRLRKEVGPVSKQLRWGYFELYDGRKTVNIYCRPVLNEAAMTLKKELNEKLDSAGKINLKNLEATLPELQDEMAVVIFDTNDDALTGDVRKKFPDLGITKTYPARDSYSLYGPLPAGQGQMILVAGNGVSGTTLGADNFVWFIEEVYGEQQ
jgi:hypothetical protein